MEVAQTHRRQSVLQRNRRLSQQNLELLAKPRRQKIIASMQRIAEKPLEQDKGQNFSNKAANQLSNIFYDTFGE